MQLVPVPLIVQDFPPAAILLPKIFEPLLFEGRTIEILRFAFPPFPAIEEITETSGAVGLITFVAALAPTTLEKNRPVKTTSVIPFGVLILQVNATGQVPHLCRSFLHFRDVLVPEMPIAVLGMGTNGKNN